MAIRVRQSWAKHSLVPLSPPDIAPKTYSESERCQKLKSLGPLAKASLRSLTAVNGAQHTSAFLVQAAEYAAQVWLIFIGQHAGVGRELEHLSD